jgi:hypothetical protein
VLDAGTEGDPGREVDGPASFDNEDTKTLLREQLFKGGVRLAAILNDIFR